MKTLTTYEINALERETAQELIAMGAGLAEDYDEFFEHLVDDANKGD